jgi:hypothetical protein
VHDCADVESSIHACCFTVTNYPHLLHGLSRFWQPELASLCSRCVLYDSLSKASVQGRVGCQDCCEQGCCIEYAHNAWLIGQPPGHIDVRTRAPIRNRAYMSHGRSNLTSAFIPTPALGAKHTARNIFHLLLSAKVVCHTSYLRTSSISCVMAAYEMLRYLGQHVSGQHADVTVNTNPIFEPSEDASDQFTTATSTPRWLESCSSGRSLEAKPDREVQNAKGATSQPRMNGCRGTDASCAQYVFAHSKCYVRSAVYGG